MALANKGFRTPPPIEPKGIGPGIPKKSSRFEKGGLGGDASRIFRKEVISPLGQALGNVIRGPKIPQKAVKEEKITKKRRGVFDTLLGPTPKKEKKAISPKTKSSLFGKGEKAIKYEEFEKFLKDPSLYKIDKLSSYQRKKKWGEIFKKTGTGYIERWKVEKYFKEITLKSPKDMKEVREKYLDEQYRKKILGK